MAATNQTHETVAIDAQDDDLEDRDIRALLTPMTVIDNCGQVADAADMFEVTTDSGSEYTVDLRTESCTCPDHEYRDVRCKHIRRCAFEVGRRAIPGHVNFDTLDDQLGEHVTTGRPRVAMTDGGVAAEQAEEPVTETAGTLATRIGFVIGIDGKGDAHVHHPAANLVMVYDVGNDYEIGDRITGEPTFTQDLGDRPLEHWMQYVEDERGEWQTTTHRAPDGFAGGEEVSA